MLLGAAGGGPLTVGEAGSPLYIARGPSRPFSTSPATLTIAGGQGPYTVAWSYVSGWRGFTCLNPTGAVTSWGGTASYTSSYSAVWKWKVTDARGPGFALGGTVEVNVTPAA